MLNNRLITCWISIVLFLIACDSFQRESNTEATRIASEPFATQTAEVLAPTETPTQTPAPTLTPIGCSPKKATLRAPLTLATAMMAKGV